MAKEPDRSDNERDIDWRSATWDGARREQMRRWAELPLERAIMALEEMEEVAKEFAQAPQNSPVARETQQGYVTGSPTHDLELLGCTPEPLMAYLKALGILRLVSEQKDPNARGWWRNDVFWIRSSLDREALVKFFLQEYQPTPIVAPWAGGSGFFSKDNKKAVEELSKSCSVRVRRYSQVIMAVRAIIQDEQVGDKPRDEDKVQLIKRYRNELPDDVVSWMDTAMVLHQDGQGFAPLLGTGGNDGRLDFSQNFMQRVVALGLHKDELLDDRVRGLLMQALFAALSTLDEASVGQFAPGRAGGANATQGMEGDPIDNPWDFILMIEGTLLLAGAAVRRLSGPTSMSAFPFTASVVDVGASSLGPRDHVKPKQAKRDVSEMWMPCWSRPVSLRGVETFLAEGRTDLGGGGKVTGLDFARAASMLGVDRGISEFQRFTLLMRNGQSFIAAPAGRYPVMKRAGVDLIREIDPWLKAYRWASADKYAPPQFGAAIRGIDSAIIEYCKHGGASVFLRVVVSLGAAERVLVRSEHFRDKKKLKPLSGLSEDWSKTADDGSMEFALARALVSVHDAEGKIGPFRANLESVDWQERSQGRADKDRAVVWNAADLSTNMASVLQRRMMDGDKAGCGSLPVAARVSAPLALVAAFLNGGLDAERTENLIWGLMLINGGGNCTIDRSMSDAGAVPSSYALLKLLFLPRPVVVGYGANGDPSVRLLRNHEQGGILIRPEQSILQLLRGGRLGEACAIAARRLRASGLNPMPGRIRGWGVRDDNWRELDGMTSVGMDAKGIAAALLIPVSDEAVSKLARLVIRGEVVEENCVGTVVGTNS